MCHVSWFGEMWMIELVCRTWRLVFYIHKGTNNEKIKKRENKIKINKKIYKQILLLLVFLI
jgi:hypothetical protein